MTKKSSFISNGKKGLKERIEKKKKKGLKVQKTQCFTRYPTYTSNFFLFKKSPIIYSRNPN